MRHNGSMACGRIARGATFAMAAFFAMSGPSSALTPDSLGGIGQRFHDDVVQIRAGHSGRPGGVRPGPRPGGPGVRPNPRPPGGPGYGPGPRPPGGPGYRPPGPPPPGPGAGPGPRPPGYRPPPPGYRPPPPGGWARPGWYAWPVGGAIAAGAAIGFVSAAAAASWAGAPPAPGMCWYYTDSSMTRGFWDYCP